MATPFETSIPATPEAVGTLRRAMATLAEDCGMDAEGIDDVRLAVSEAATNVVIHAYPDAEGELSLTAAVQSGELAIVIGDVGQGIDLGRDSSGMGVGLVVIAAVTASLRIVSDPAGTSIHMRFPCPNEDQT